MMTIRKNEQYAAYLLPAIKTPTEVQDLKLINEADKKDM